ncbi:helix-turn-helix domain-containing protein [Haliangium sp. UPWRP_2]|uniref:helix-turn-helix domain-containing protein n=1 Tax=Haliangium sp. UPWRP_2 TaxID=1931276 RepID=UPI001304F58D|nr:helix-turn-helix domain-containing protein [Haliangium sp. UPWRP_2]
MPQDRPQSEEKYPRRKPRRASSRAVDEPIQAEAKRPTQRASLASGAALRRHALSQLTQIQINTAGLSGPYRSDAETMQRVCANHAAVRQVRIVLRRAIVIARQSPLLAALISQALCAGDGNLAQAARSLGMTTRQLRRVLDTQDHPRRSAQSAHRRCADAAQGPAPSS